MKIHQITIRPSDNKGLVLFLDDLGQRFQSVFDTTGNAAVRDLIADCERRLPPDEQHPKKTEIEHQIHKLEARIVRLKEAIDAT